MDEWIVALLAAGLLVAAFGYASVGHGGASAYIAAMALAGVAPAEMRPIALLPNILVSSLGAERLAKKHSQRRLIIAGFATTIAGIAVLLALVKGSPSVAAFAPGLLLIGLGLGTMLTPSVNVVQSSFGEAQQGEISGLSRSVSNLGSSLGTAIAGTILVSDLASPDRSYALAMITLGALGVVGLIVATRLPDENPSPSVDGVH